MGEKDGEGIETYPNGDIYEGSFRYGLPHGYGTYFYNDGSIFEGEQI